MISKIDPSSLQFDIQIQGSKRNLKSLQAPHFSKLAAKALKELGHEISHDLDVKVKTFEGTLVELKNSRAQHKRNKILNVVKTALYVALIAGITLGAIALATVHLPLALVFAVFALFAIFGLGIYLTHKALPELKGDKLIYIGMSILGPPILAIYSVYGKDDQESEKIELKAEFERENIQKAWELIYKFFETNFDPVKQVINEKLRAAKSSLAESNEMTTDNPVLQAEIDKYEEVLRELEREYNKYVQLNLEPSGENDKL